MSLIGRLICFITNKHDKQWTPALTAMGTPNEEGIEVYWCPRCTRIFDISYPEDDG